MDVFIPLNRSMVEILLNRRPPCLNSNAVAAPCPSRTLIPQMPQLNTTVEKQAELRQNHWRLLSGFGDFISIIAGCAVILVLITMLVSLLNWLHSDILQSISLFQTMI